jgi:dipeptidyl-peptidase-4
VTLGLISVAGGATTWIDWDRDRYPYLATVTWTEKAPLTILVQNRAQTEEMLLAVDPATGATTPLLTERDDAWLNLFKGMPAWTVDGKSFVWVSERDGEPRLELHGRDGALVNVLTPAEPWLHDGGVDLDETHGIAWVRASADPTETHLFQVPLDPKLGAPKQMTTGAGQHGAIFCKDRSRFVHTLSLADDRPHWVVRSREGKPLGELRSVAETPVIAQRAEFVTVGDSPELHAVVIRPDNFDSRRRYPVIVSVYGGPHAQMVTKSAQGYSVQQWMANQGFIVVSLDGRGTPNRGRAWERAIKGNLIDVPLNDQVDGLHALGNRFPEMDLSRVGITGGSFGGYFSALALERRPTVYQAAVAVAPVVDWRDYDTHYTERYMNTPEQNRTGYDGQLGRDVGEGPGPPAAHHARHRRRQRLLPPQPQAGGRAVPRRQDLRVRAAARIHAHHGRLDGRDAGEPAHHGSLP